MMCVIACLGSEGKHFQHFC